MQGTNPAHQIHVPFIVNISGDAGVACVQKTAQMIAQAALRSHHGVVINQTVERHGNTPAGIGPRAIIDIGNDPVGPILRADDPQVIASPPKTGRPVLHAIGPRQRVLGIEVLGGRDITEHVQIAALHSYTMVEHLLIVLGQMPRGQTGVHVSHLSPVPVVHKRDMAFLPGAESRAGESGGPAYGILLVHRKLRIVGRSIDLIVTILIVQIVNISKLLARIDPPFQPFPATGRRRGWQDVRMLAVVSQIGPAGQGDVQPVDTAGLEFAKPFRQLVEGGYPVVSRCGVPINFATRGSRAIFSFRETNCPVSITCFLYRLHKVK